MRLPPLPSLTDLIRLYKLKAKKQLAQNFLLDMNLTHKIVHKAGRLNGHHVIEVGPGPGGITRAIFEAGAKQVYVVEKDRRFMPGLEMLRDAVDGRLEIHNGDILDFDAGMRLNLDQSLRRDWSDAPPPIDIIGNLPFNVSTPLIIKWLKAMSTQSDIWTYGRVPLTLTFQKEVADRMVAPTCTEQRSRLSIICQNLCDVTDLFTIKGKAFVPAPDVDVGVVKFEPRVQPEIDLPFEVVDKVVRHIFHYRQKQIKRGVSTLFPPDQSHLGIEMLRIARVSGTRLCTRLHMDEIRPLCHAYYELCHREPGLLEYDYRSGYNAEKWRYQGQHMMLEKG